MTPSPRVSVPDSGFEIKGVTRGSDRRGPRGDAGTGLGSPDRLQLLLVVEL